MSQSPQTGPPGPAEQTACYFSYAAYTGPPPAAQPPQVVVQQVGVDPGQVCRLQEKCTQLEYRLAWEKARTALKEEALQQLFAAHHSYLITLPSGNVKAVTDFVFQRVRHLQYDALYGVKPLVELTVSGRPDPLLCEADAFFSDKKLLDRLQAHTRSQIRLYGSPGRVMSLLRGQAAVLAEEVFVPALAGWLRDGAAWDYRLFPNGTTCGLGALPPEAPERPPVPSPAGAQAAAREVQKAFSAVRRPALRGTLFLWLHAGFLCTLLDSLRASVPKALYLCLPGITAEDYLTKLLGTAQGRVLSLADAPSEFAEGLLRHKDQLVLVRDPAAGGWTAENLRRLMTAHASRRTDAAQPGRPRRSAPFLALPVLLGSEDSALSLGADVLPLRAAGEDFDPARCEQVLQAGDFKPEHWSALAGYVGREGDGLARCMREGRAAARRRADEHGLPPAAGALLGTLLGIRALLEGFFSQLSLSLEETVPPAWEEEFLLLLEEDAGRPAMLDGLAEAFAQAARSMIRAGRLVCYPRGRSWSRKPPCGAVYLDASAFAFDKAAFEAVCGEAGCNSMAVRRELDERGFLLGRRVNRASYATRIAACNAYGRPVTLSVYAVSRELMEAAGEPPLLPAWEGG